MPNHFLGNRKQYNGTGGPNTGGGFIAFNSGGPNGGFGNDAHTKVFNYIGRIANKAATANTTTLAQMAKNLSKLKI